jgi:hypothetical protein
MNLSNRAKSRISLFVLFILFEAGIFVISRIAPALRLDPFLWVMLVFAAAMGGAGVAYMFIGEWIRWPLTKEVPHSSSAKMIEIEPKYEGWLKSPGALLCCPICAATWVGAGLLGLLALDYSLGYYSIVILSAAGAGRLIIRASEMFEWQSRYAQERTAELNRKNEHEEALLNAQPFLQGDKQDQVWLLKEKEEVEEEKRYTNSR